MTASFGQPGGSYKGFRLADGRDQSAVADEVQSAGSGARHPHEVITVFQRDRIGARETKGQRVTMSTINLKLVVQMRAAGETRGTHVADGLDLIHETADVQVGVVA